MKMKASKPGIYAISCATTDAARVKLWWATKSGGV